MNIKSVILKKRGIFSGLVLLFALILCFYFVFSEPRDFTPSELSHSFTPGDGYGVANYTKGGENATINFTIIAPTYTETQENVTEITIALPNNVILNDIYNLSNGTAVNVSGGDDWDCQSENAAPHTYRNWSCYNGTDSQLGSGDQINIWFNFSANRTGTEEAIVWGITIVGNSSDQDANTTIYSTNIDDQAPRVTLDGPADFSNYTNTGVVFNYTATDANLDTCQMYGNWGSGWHLNETFLGLTSGATNGSTNLTLENGTYVWNVLCNDSFGYSNFSQDGANFTITVDTGPESYVVGPISNELYGSANVQFILNVSSYVGASNISISIYNAAGSQLYQKVDFDMGEVLGYNQTKLTVNMTDNITELGTLYGNNQFTWDFEVTDIFNRKLFSHEGNQTPIISLFGFCGNVSNSTYDLVEGANVTIYEFAESVGLPPVEDVVMSVITADNSTYTFLGINNTISLFKIKVKINDSNDNWTEVGPIIPPLPSTFMVSGLGNGTIYTQPAATLRLNAYDATSWSDEFNFIILDLNLGSELESKISNINATANTEVVLPRDRNVTFIYMRGPENFGTDQSVPPMSYAITNLSDYSSTDYVIELNRSLAYDEYSLEGYINVSQNISYVNCTTFIARLTPGVSGIVPPNSRLPLDYYYQEGVVDSFIGQYNISVLGSSDGIYHLIELYCNGTDEYFGAMEEIQINASSVYGHNITVTALAGNLSYDTYYSGTGLNTTTICFNLTDATNPGKALQDVMVDLEVKHSSFGTLHYMVQASGAFNRTFLNDSTAYLRLFSHEYAPTRKQIDLTRDYCEGSNNISLQKFRMETADESGNVVPFSSGALRMMFMRNNNACNVVSPADSCAISDSLSPDAFNPLQAIMGGKSNLLIDLNNGTGASLYFINVDLLSSGPPDAVLSENATTDVLSADSLDQIWQFGSLAPDIYDYALIGLPYNDSVVESWNFNVKIPVFYDEDHNIIWNTTENGTDFTAFTASYSDYADYPSSWFGGYDCSKTESNFSSTNCYMNTSENKFWIKIPHFSDVNPNPSGSPAPGPGPVGGGGDGGGEGVTAPGYEEITGTAYTLDLAKPAGVLQVMTIGDGGVFTIKGKTHTVVVRGLSWKEVILDIYSEKLMSVVLKAGESKDLDINKDGFKEFRVTVKNIDADKEEVELYFKLLEKPVPTGEVVEEVEEVPKVPVEEEKIAPKKVKYTGFLILVIAGVAGLAYFIYKKKASKKKKK